MESTTERAESLESFLDSQPWDDIIDELTAYARKRMLRQYWRGERNGLPPGGTEAIDFAMQAIEAVYTGRRKWDRIKYPEFRWFLMLVVKSLVSNAATKAENRLEMEFPDDVEVAAPPTLFDDEDTFVLELLDYLNDEPELQKVIGCIEKGITDRREIATALGVSQSDITNMRKKLSRRLTAFRTLKAGRS